jgi:hypothetical protein
MSNDQDAVKPALENVKIGADRARALEEREAKGGRCGDGRKVQLLPCDP